MGLGGTININGIIIKGTSTLDESMITGESLPQNKTINDNVIGGTININGTIRVKITKNANQSTVSKIISLTKSATLSKIPIERLTDKVSKYFVYVVILISIITFVVWYSFTKNTELALNFSLSVLVISCPCALGLATPSAIMVAIGNCARNAILIKNPRVLEIIGKIKYIILDKTGTLTKNKLEIVDIQEYSNEFINVLSSLEKLSNHPIANTILDKYNDGDIIFDKFEQISSEGIVGYLNNDLYFAGNSKLASKYINIQNNNINDDYSYIIVGKNDTLLGVIYISDILRPSSMIAIDRLKKMNIIPIMCTGDKESIAKQISKKLQINQYVSSVKPEDKNALVIEKKKQGIVGMVGDGINDAIALSSADVSISLANATDIATSTSDILLMGNDINDIPFLINVSKKTIRIIKQNLFWALFYNSIFIPLAAGVFYNSYGLILNPMIGAATMCISSIIVLTNALRINSIKKEELITMNKTISIEGMMCNNCARHVKEALEALGANVNVVLEENKAYLENTSLSDEQIRDAITTAGYTVTEIKND